MEVKVRKNAEGAKVSQEVEYQTERLDHLGIVAGVCREAEIAEWLDEAQETGVEVWYGDNHRRHELE